MSAYQQVRFAAWIVIALAVTIAIRAFALGHQMHTTLELNINEPVPVKSKDPVAFEALVKKNSVSYCLDWFQDKKFFSLCAKGDLMFRRSGDKKWAQGAPPHIQEKIKLASVAGLQKVVDALDSATPTPTPTPTPKPSS